MPFSEEQLAVLLLRLTFQIFCCQRATEASEDKPSGPRDGLMAGKVQFLARHSAVQGKQETGGDIDESNHHRLGLVIESSVRGADAEGVDLEDPPKSDGCEAWLNAGASPLPHILRKGTSQRLPLLNRGLFTVERALGEMGKGSILTARNLVRD